MTARAWTVEELDRVHPLPEVWSWRIGSREQPYALGPRAQTVEVDHDELLALQHNGGQFDPPADVALAVILASKGLDSFEAMATAMEAEADGDRECCAARTLFAAEMTRRGMVEQ